MTELNVRNYSVLMTVYINDELSHVFLAIKSILEQSLATNDFIIVADGPLRPEVHDCIVSMKLKFDIINYQIIKNNVGLGNALQYGLKFADNNIIMRMDADDYSEPERAEKLLKLMTENVVVVGSYIGEFIENPNESLSIIKYKKNITNFDIKNYYRDPVGHASVMFNKNAVLDAGGYLDCLYFEDTYLWLRIAKKSIGKFVNSDEVLYKARIGNGFYSRRSGHKYLIIEMKNFIRFYKENLISFHSFLINILLRPFFRLLPKNYISIFYKKFLRSKS